MSDTPSRPADSGPAGSGPADSGPAESGLEAVSVGGDALIGLATLGKTAAALALILVIIFIASALLKRLQLRRQPGGSRLEVISATAVGPRERVVVVQVESQWLVLGVASGQVNKLHEMPAPSEPQGQAAPAPGPGFVEGDSFATRLAKALKHNAGLGRRG